MELFISAIKWIIDHKLKVIMLTVSLFVIPPLLIHLFFYLPSITPFFTAQWSAGDFLGYCAAFFAAAGTIFLGLDAIWQNH